MKTSEDLKLKAAFEILMFNKMRAAVIMIRPIICGLPSFSFKSKTLIKVTVSIVPVANTV